jgi:hypothetical protein
MKKLCIILSATILFSGCSLFAQTRYIDEVFEDIKLTENIPYATNISVLTGIPAIQVLHLDLYEPVEEVSGVIRPLIIMFHSGNYLPHPLNGSISGSKTDSTIVGLARRLAKMGFVVAAAEYRLGWNPVNPLMDVRNSTLLNAIYRSVQDANSCIRFFKRSAAESGNPYQIHPQKIILWGIGSGGAVSIHTAILESHQQTTIPKFLMMDIMGNMIPMVSEAMSGDPQGLEEAPLNMPNHTGYSSDFQLCVNMSGFVADTSWIGQGNVPMISFHVPSDPFFPYSEGSVVNPFIPPIFNIQGSYLIQQLANLYQNNQTFLDAEINDVYSDVANSRNDGYEGLYPMPRDFLLDGSPWDWWDPFSNPNHNNGIATNPDMSFEKAMIYADTIIGYFAPRAYFALKLDELMTTNKVSQSSAAVTLSPNPAKSQIFVESSAGDIIREIEVLDMNGRTVSHNRVNSTHFTIDRNGLASGTYVVKLHMDDGLIVQKIIFE